MKDQELTNRLKRIYAALGDVTNLDIDMAPPTAWADERSFGIFQDFSGGKSQDQFDNEVTLVLSAFAWLPDRARAWLKSKGEEKRDVNTFMESTLSVALMWDLANVDKHGKSGHTTFSGKSPRLLNARRVMRMTGSGLFIMTPGGSQHTRGKNNLVLTGEVMDQDGTKIMDFDDLIDEALLAWEQFLESKGLKFS